MRARVGWAAIVIGALAIPALAAPDTSTSTSTSTSTAASPSTAASDEVDCDDCDEQPGDDDDSDADDIGPWRGLHLDITTTELSGVVGEPEAYANQLSLELRPSFDLGHHLGSRFWKPLSLSASIGISGELSGSDPAFRGPQFPSSALRSDAPEAVVIDQTAAARSTSGAERDLRLSDLTLTFSHPSVAHLPARITLGAGARFILPTSRASYNDGLYTAASLSASLSRVFGRVTIRLRERATKYLYDADTSPIQPLGGSVIVSGLEVSPESFAHDGAMTPSFGFTTGLDLEVALPHDLSASAGYALVNTFSHVPDGCSVPGLPTADACADGSLIHEVRRGRHDAGSFSLGLAWQARPSLSLSLDLETYQPVRHPNGDLANPFLRVSRDNYSALSLSATVSIDELTRGSK